jgi:subtilisin family serine protease
VRALEAARSWLHDGKPRRRRGCCAGWVELAGPAAPAWFAELRRAGVAPLQAYREHSFLCSGSVPELRRAARLPFVIEVTPLVPALKHRIVIGGDPREAWIVFLSPRGGGGEVAWWARSRATLSASAQERWLGRPEVLAVEEWEPPAPHDEVAGLILAGCYDARGTPQGSYLEWLGAQGLDGAGVTIGIVDSGVDVDHPAFAGRIRDLTSGEKSWHGTAIAGLAAGRYLAERDERGFFYGLGVAPGADLLAQDRYAAPGYLCLQTATSHGPGGAPGQVQNNSFGKGTHDPMDYRSEEALYDRMVRDSDPEGPRRRPLAICFSAGNEGARGLTRPAGAKNVLVTGNTSVHRPADGGVEAERIDEVYPGDYDTNRAASSHGNCGDGRVRPHLVAPGQWAATANFNAQPGEKSYLSPALTWGGGSSGASALTAGACALLIQWWRRSTGLEPSPALLRTMIVNGAVDIGDGGPIPNPRQGWGRLNLRNVLSPEVWRAWLDQTVLLTAAGASRSWTLHVPNPALPLKVTLAWTDPPGPLGSGTSEVPAVVNRLALRVEAGGHTYRGNRFDGGWTVDETSETGPGEHEGWDNLQNIYLPAGAVADGAARVTVIAIELAADAVTGRVEPPRQDFALWISNAFPAGGQVTSQVALAPLPNG